LCPLFKSGAIKKIADKDPPGVAKIAIYGIFSPVMSLFKRFLLQIAVGVLGLYLADYFLVEVTITEPLFLLYGGVTLGVINFFIRPVLRLITLPLRILTLGLFTFFINAAIVWFTQAAFLEITIEGFTALIYTTIIVWILEFLIYNFSK
jgi:putative membrane protein